MTKLNKPVQRSVDGLLRKPITVGLPAVDKVVPLDAYVRAVKTAIANPQQEFKHGLTCWWPCTGAAIQAQFLAGVHDRINQGIPYTERGE